MLPRAHRLTRRSDFTEVVRGGRRSSRPLLTVHLLVPAPAAASSGPAAVPAAPPVPAPPARAEGAAVRAGLVVSKAVGGSVVRSRVARRLRHLLRDRLGALPAGARLVVRAAPGAASAQSRDLGRDLDAALERLLRPRGAGR